ncbi:protein PSK SIMULATOR 2-like isoform X3 [Phragmites australis]|uniref:protein PSK SIMULATOR 2-like isoform X3 n=1 Tax=Phragmites australis TaxID=29695 RepID=UPI002D7670BD|nr:protein PSK SIMULATOR 2-like isoform X3 [Phragmites australis]
MGHATHQNKTNPRRGPDQPQPQPRPHSTPRLVPPPPPPPPPRLRLHYGCDFKLRGPPTPPRPAPRARARSLPRGPDDDEAEALGWLAVGYLRIYLPAMGGVCSRRFPDEAAPRSLAAAYDARLGRYGPGDFDSGELAIPPPKPPSSHKVSETGTLLGRASIAGLEKAVEVLDTLGSSMTSLNHGSGFLSGGTNRGNKVCILAFEVANTIAKASSLWRSCSDESIEELKEEILHSDGVRILVSSNSSELLHIAAVDKREELAIFSREVIRFGDLCKDPIWHNLGRYFDKLTTDYTPQDHSKESMEATVQQLINLAQSTSELYHELHALDRFEQDFQTKFHEDESVPPARRESVMILHSELKRQRKLVKNLKKKSLWSKTLEEIVEKLVDIVIFLHKQIRDAFNEAVLTGTDFFDPEQAQSKRLGSCGLALHYANIINQIENIVSRPLSLPPSARDNLYHGLPKTVKSALRSRLQSSNTEEERTVAQIKAEMQKTLRWLLPVAENTIRAHQGFGWVGEWANHGSEMSKKSGSQHSVTRIQTLHHADKAKTEQYILELVVLLHHLVVQVKNRGYGNKSAKHDLSRSRKGLDSQAETKHNTSPINNGTVPSPLSDCERETLDQLSFKRTSYGRSTSCEPPPDRGNKAHRSWDSCRSQGNSPAREFGRNSISGRDKTRDLDVIDGLDRLTSSPTFY